MSSTGAFIVIEGVDGAGKATQTELLAARLRANGYDVLTVSFPRYDEQSSYFAREYLAGNYGETARINPYTASLLYALDRYQAAQEIRDALETGKIVVANRYVGSNMAHQGAKFHHPDERRGFFIWLDSVEYQTLNVPRPDKSIVLNVPADTAAQRVEARPQPKDAHERDTVSLAEATQVFIELCDLFPNDFLRVDCTRSEKPLDVDAVHAMVWGAVEPLLPSPDMMNSSAKIMPAKTNRRTAKTDTAAMTDVSALLALRLGAVSTIPANPEFYTPKTLDDSMRKEYQTTMTEILGLRQEILQTVARHLQAAASRKRSGPTADALSVVDSVLPYCVLTRVPLSLIEQSVTAATDLAEGAALGLRPLQRAARELANLANEYLPDNHAAVVAEPQLITYWPRNELELLPEILYEFANVPIDSIRTAIEKWPIGRKQDALAQFIRSGLARNRVLESYRYIWDILADYTSVSELLRCGVVVSGQSVTPRYGYDVPRIIEEANISDQFEQCYDMSLSLFSRLQAEGFDQEAQYAVLLGHKQRYSATVTAAHSLGATRDALGAAIVEKLLEIHPVLHEAKALSKLEKQ